MALVDEVLRKQQAGASEMDIRTALTQQGLSGQQIYDVLQQAHVKGAVGGGSQDQISSAPGTQPVQFEGMQPSLFLNEQQTSSGSSPLVRSPPVLANSSNPSVQTLPAPSMPPLQNSPMSDTAIVGSAQQPAVQDYVPAGGNYGVDMNQGYGGEYGGDQYQPYQETMNTEMVSEIAEQIVGEKLTYIQNSLEHALDFKESATEQIANLDRRMIRIEQIIDRLQLSLLQRVGEYVQDVRDIKNEMVETQKSFASLLRQGQGGSGQKAFSQEGTIPGHGQSVMAQKRGETILP